MFWAVVTPARVSVSELASGMSVKLVPPLVDSCHCTAGVGVPDAAAVNVTLAPSVTDRSAGWVVIWGAITVVLTVNVAAVEVALPPPFVNTAR